MRLDFAYLGKVRAFLVTAYMLRISIYRMCVTKQLCNAVDCHSTLAVISVKERIQTTISHRVSNLV